MEMLPTDERMCHILSTSADKTETVIPDTTTTSSCYYLQQFEECKHLSASQQFEREQQGHPNEPPVLKHSTVQVKGVLPDTSRDLLVFYFENTRRSKGGPVSSIDMKPDLQICSITFKNSEGMQNFFIPILLAAFGILLQNNCIHQQLSQQSCRFVSCTTISV